MNRRLSCLFIPLALPLLLHAAARHKHSTPPSDFAAQIKRVGHVIVIYQENWSFDGLFGRFPGANGLANAGAAVHQVDRSGKPLSSLPQPTGPDGKPDSRFPPANGSPALPVAPFDLAAFIKPADKTGDMIHAFRHEQQQIDHGKMDRFVTWSNNGGLVMSYIDTSDFPEGKLAREFVLCDNFFHSAFGGSFLNHQFFIAAAPPRWPDAPANFVSDDPVKDAPVTSDGFAVNTLLSVNPPLRPGTPPGANLLPDQTHPTIGDRLTAKGVSWKWYAGGYDDAMAGHPDRDFQYHHQPFVYFANYKAGTEARKQHLQDEKNFHQDLQNGTLPAVSFIKFLGPDNEHPGYASLQRGQEHTAAVVDEIRRSAVWKDAVIVVSYDENGGRWDHVAPPVIDRFGPGTRVATIVISPFARRHFVDHTRYETVSILKFLELRFGLDSLTSRDANANPLSNAFDFQARRHSHGKPGL